MSKLTDIKNRIDQMDGGAFQNLCDAYLSYKGYKNVYSLGMRTGTDKTAKGNPDTYFLTAENKYVFVMYTTQKTDFLKKAIEDIDKCFDSQKTGVSAEDIVEIIYCHTYGRLGPGDDQYRRIDSLRKYEIVEPKIMVKALRTISEHYEESPFIFSLYVFWILNHSNQEADETLREFYNELPLLEEIYLKGISYSNHEDFDGALLYAIISVDTSFLYRYLDCLIIAQEGHFRVHNDYDIARLLKIWDTEQYIDLADGVFDYCYDKREESIHWLYWSPVNMMLHHEASHQEIIVKQDLWIQHTIEKYGHDGERMHQLFVAIEELSCERRKKAVEKFLSLNANPDVFEQLPLEPSHWGGTGSMIPYMQERIEYLRSLLPLVSGIKYLKQKQRIEREVDCWKQRIHSEEVRELLESWYR